MGQRKTPLACTGKHCMKTCSSGWTNPTGTQLSGSLPVSNMSGGVSLLYLCPSVHCRGSGNLMGRRASDPAEQPDIQLRRADCREHDRQRDLRDTT